MSIAGKQSLRGPALRRTGPGLQGSDIARLTKRAAPAFDTVALLKAGRLFGGNEQILSTQLNDLPPPVWQEGLGALRYTFGLQRKGHCFTVAPHVWAWFHEPQITGGFVHYLTGGSLTRCKSRAEAFLRAAFRCAGRSCDFLGGRTVSHVAAEAELAVGKGKRIDILLELTLDDGSCAGVVIEAKFGADLSARQLGSYHEHATNRPNWCSKQSVFLVVAPQLGSLNRAVLDANPDWASRSWWTFLCDVEQELPPQHDCDDYRRFRRTVWNRAYGS